MTMIVKRRSDADPLREVMRWKRSGESNWITSTATFSTPSSDEISYSPGPKYISNHCNWKECVHRWRSTPNRVPFSYSERVGPVYYDYDYSSALNEKPIIADPPPASKLPDSSEVWKKVYDQINLNTSDGVLLYSGIIQAIPLLGGAMNAVSVLNRAGRSLSRSMRRRPFTTVVKSLIQADFIDRFVVRPTLQDMQKFADSFDYVLRVINTAQERNRQVATAFEATTENIISQSSVSVDDYYAGARVQGTRLTKSSASRTIFMLAKVTYDADCISPFKLWAARAGLSRPLDSAWDMIPFSFVLDYFVRAGDFLSHVSDTLSDQDALVGRIGKVFDCWQTTKCETFSLLKASLTPRNSRITHFTGGSVEIKTSAGVFTREQVPVMSEPGFWDGEGLISPKLSTTRLRTLAELLIQARL